MIEVIKDGTVTIDTIYRFAENGSLIDNVYRFLFKAKEANCTVVFENEGITVPPKDSRDDTMTLLERSVKITVCEAFLSEKWRNIAQRGIEMAGLV